MTIKNPKDNKVLIGILSVLTVLGISIVMSYLTLHLATATSAASGDMISFVYGVGTLAVGIITVAGYIGTATMFGIGIAMLNDHGKE